MPVRSPFSLTPWVRRLIIANAVVYLLTITVFTGGWFYQAFAFTPVVLAKQPWTLLTYMFLHAGFLHLAFNLLALFFFGPAVEERMGGLSFVRYYFLCGLGGAALSFAFALILPSVTTTIGASAAVYGVSLAFAYYWPDTPVYVFPFPVPVKVKWLVAVLAALDIVMAIGGAGDGVAHLAHLGGFLFGFLYLKGESLLEHRGRSTREERSEARVLVHPSAEVARHREEPPARRDHDDATQREIDRVLDKISAKGIASLTAEERRFLSNQGRSRKKD